VTLLRTLLLAGGIASASGLASAQGQSVGNAHGFFQAVVRSHPVLFTDFMVPAPHTRDLVALESAGCTSRVTVQQPGREPSELALDWKRIDSVRVEGERDLRLRGRGVDTMLGFPSRELAARMGNALSMVRRECDPLGGFGF
jgi:hypothetical protein